MKKLPASSKKGPKFSRITLDAPKNNLIESSPKNARAFFNRMLAPLRTLGIERERAAFIQNLGVLLKAGISLTEAMETIHLDLKYRRMKRLAGFILNDINAGIPFWKTLETHGVLTSYQLSIIRIGEEAGFLAQNVEHLALQQEKDRALRRKVQMALFYPSIVFVLSIIVMSVITIFVLPQLVTVLNALNTELPLITRMVIALSAFAGKNGITVLIAMGAGAVLCYILYLFWPVKYIVHLLLLRVPVISSILQDSSVARMGIILGTLLKVGIPPVRAIEHLADSLPLLPYRKYFHALSLQIDVGKSFQHTMAMTPGTNALIPRPAQQLIVSGEKSGQIADMFMKISEIYSVKTEELTQMLPIVIEPILLIFIAGSVGIIAYSILVPIYSIVSSV